MNMQQVIDFLLSHERERVFLASAISDAETEARAGGETVEPSWDDVLCEALGELMKTPAYKEKVQNI